MGEKQDAHRMRKNFLEATKLKDIKLDLMDWKAIEIKTEETIREAITTIKISEPIRVEAKKQIKSFGGNTSEEEEKIEKKKAKELREKTT